MDEEEEPKLVEPTEPLEPELALDQNEASTPEDMGDMEGEEDVEEPGADRSWLPTIAVGIAALVLGLFLGYLGRGQFGPEAQAARATQTAVAQVSATRAAAGQELMKNLVDHARHIKGSPDAKSIIIEFSDFQCPYCGAFATDVGRLIDENHVKTGEARFIYWNFAFLGDESQWAAEAAECAADQDKYWEFYDKLFASQKGENQGAFSKDNLKKMAADLGLDTGTFNQCLDSGKYTQQIAMDTQIAQQIGVRSTPTFLVNGVGMEGAQSYEEFQRLIEQFQGK